MISDLNLLLNHYDNIVCDIICKLCIHIIVRIQRPQSDRNWDSWRGWLWCEDHMCSQSVNALLRCSIKRNTLIASSEGFRSIVNQKNSTDANGKAKI